MLRASRGFTQRANSVVTAGSPGMPLAAALDAVERWYAARGLPPNLTVAGPAASTRRDDPLGALLLARGYPVARLTLALTASGEEVAAADPGGPSVSIEPTPGRRVAAGLPRHPQEATPETARGLSSPAAPDSCSAPSVLPGGGLSQQLGLRAA